MLEPAEILQERCRVFAARVLTFVKGLPVDAGIGWLARQLAMSSTGASANCHSAWRGRSRAEFIARMSVALDGADESCAWLAVVREGRYATGPDLEWLERESQELRAIFARSVTTVRRNQGSRSSRPTSSR